MTKTTTKTRDWRCSTCAALLGVQSDQEAMHVRYKDFFAIVRGRVTVCCRRCTAANTFDTERGQAFAA